MRRVARGLVPGVVAVAVLASACSSQALPGGREGDIVFAQEMIPHHEQALEMAEIALTKDVSPALASVAREIRREQDPQVVLLRSWLGDWGADELPHSGGPGEGSDDHEHAMAGMATGEQLRALADASGPDFEDLWLDLMIAHHEGAISMAEQVREGSEDLQVQALAEEIVASQRDEIERMRGLRRP